MPPNLRAKGIAMQKDDNGGLRAGFGRIAVDYIDVSVTCEDAVICLSGIRHLESVQGE